MCQCICFATYVSSFQGVHSSCEIKSEMQLLPGTSILNSLWLSDVIWQSGSTLFLVMACCLAAPSHYLKQCWSVINSILWHLHESSFMGCTENGYQSSKSIWKLYFWSTATFARGHWVNAMLHVLHICIIVQFHNYNSNDFFPQIYAHNRYLTADQWGWGMGYLLWVQGLNYVVPLSLQCCIQYKDIFYCFITSLICTHDLPQICMHMLLVMSLRKI